MVALPVVEEEARWLRAYRRAITLWSSQVADEGSVASAAVYVNGKLPGVVEANCIVGELTRASEAELQQRFARAGVEPLAWYLPAGDAELPGLREHRISIWRLQRIAHTFPQTHPELTIVTGRASFPHVRAIAAAMHPKCDADAAGEAAVLHLDDPRVDAVLLLRESGAVGYATVLSTGEAGFVMELWVHPDARGRGFGSALTGRVLDICARSQFREVYWAIPSGDAQAESFAGHVGFASEGEVMLRTLG